MGKKKQNIIFKNKEYIKFKNITSGGGSDSIWVVLDKIKYNKILNEFIAYNKETKEILEKISTSISMGKSNISQKIEKKKSDLQIVFKTAIEKYINHEKLNKYEKIILKAITGEDYLQRMKFYNNTKRLYNKFNQKLPIKEPDNDKAIFVIKNFSAQKLKNSKWKIRFENEIEFSKKTNSKYIIKYLDSEYLGNKQEDKQSLCALMPFYPKTLRDIINNRDNYTFDTRLKMVMQLCKALKYIHMKNMWHRDIKPENIFVDNHNNIVLADFGIAHFPDSNITVTSDDFKNRAYAAPEQLIKNNYSNIGPHTDIYSLGLIINELFTGNVPRANDYEKIADYYPQHKWLDLLVSSMIKKSISDRISDIKIIISEINLFKAKTKNKQLWDKLSYLLNTNKFYELYILSKKERNNTVKMIEKDLLIAKNIFETKNKEELKKYEINYHSVIGYELSDDLKNIIIQCIAYNKCLNMFIYESNSIDSYKSIDTNSNEFVELKKMLDINKSKYIDLNGLTLKYFLSCCDYHCKEIIANLTKQINETLDDLTDSPILYLIVKIRNLINDDIYYKLINDKNFLIERNFYPIKLHVNAYSSESIFHTLTDFEKEKKDKIIKLLKNNYKVLTQTSDDKMEISAIFNSSIKYKGFFKECFDNLKNIPKEKQYVKEGDLLDIKNKIEFGNKTFRIVLNEHEINLLIELFKL